MDRTFAILFWLTGTFAMLGAGYTWGKGCLLSQTQLTDVWIPWADLLCTGPASLVAGWGLWRQRDWARVVASAVSGAYIFGSVLVFVQMAWNGEISALVAVPAASGLVQGALYLVVAGRAARGARIHP